VAPGFCLQIGETEEGVFAAECEGESITPTPSSKIQNSQKKGEKYGKIGIRELGGSRKNCFVNK
jgi:hypothetical protein